MNCIFDLRTVLPGWILALLLSAVSVERVSAQDGWGHLSGRIVVNGNVPEPAELNLGTDDRAYCVGNDREFTDRSLLTGPDGGLQDAYVMMYFARGDDRRPTAHPSYAEAAEQAVVLNNAECRFEPRAIMLRTGQNLKFTNSDSIGHNCHVVTFRNEENISLGAGQELELTLEEADRVPGIVKCDVHPWMEALILVRDEPYMAITGKDGSFRIENIPAGEWSFQFWHKRPGYLKTLTRDGEEITGRRGEMTLTIRDGETLELGDLQIPVDDLVD